MIRLLFSLCLLAITSNFAIAQKQFHWEWLQSPGTTAPSQIVVLSNGDLVVGAKHAYIHSSDGGVSWDIIPLPSHRGSVISTAATPGAEVIFNFEDLTLLRWHPGDKIARILPNIGDNRIRCDRHGILYGIRGSISFEFSTNSGDTWTSRATPLGETINDLSADDTLLYAATGSGIYTSADTGRTWKRCLNDLAQVAYYAIVAGSRGYVWAINANSNLMFSSNHGQHWKSLTNSIDFHYPLVGNKYNEVIGLLEEYRFSGFATFGDAIIARSDFHEASGDSMSNFEVMAVDSSSNWITSIIDYPNLRISNRSLPWIWESLLAPLSTTDNLTELPPYIIEYSRRLFLDVNGAWRTLPGNEIMPMYYDRQHHLYFEYSKQFGIAKSLDTGRTWQSIHPSIPGGNVSFTIAFNGDLYLGSRGIFRSSDIGTNWEETNDQSIFGVITALGADSLGRVYAGVTALLYQMEPNGAWTQTTFASARSIINIKTNAKAGLVLLTDDNVLHRSLDRGANWTTASFPPNFQLADYLVDTSGNVFAAGTHGVLVWPLGKDHLYYAGEGLDSMNATSIQENRDKQLFVGTDGLGVFKGVGDLATLRVASMRQASEQPIAFPNPATNFLTVATREKDERIEIVDQVGRVRYSTLSKTAGLQQCDLTTIPSGSYFLITTNSTGITTTKIAIER